MAMAGVLVDSNVILDVVNEDAEWFEWSAGQLERLAESRVLIINPIVYSEVSIGFDRIEDLDRALPADFVRREPLPWEAGFWQENASSNTANPVARGVRHCLISISAPMRQ